MGEASNYRLIDLLVKHFDHEYVPNMFERHEIKMPATDSAEGVKYMACTNLVREIRADGSHSMFNMFGREPVNYSEVAYDVAVKLGARIGDEYRDDEIKSEEAALQMVMQKYIDGLPAEKRQELYTSLTRDLGEKLAACKVQYIAGGGAEFFAALAFAGQMAGKEAMRQVLIQILGAQAAWQVAGQVGSRLAGLVVPGLNILLAGWLLADLGGPAYRKTVPTIVEIAYIRLMDGME